MMTQALDTSAPIVATSFVGEADAAWKNYCALMKRADADQTLLLDRDFCAELARSWIAFRELMGTAQ